jgi:hypothetical protein
MINTGTQQSTSDQSKPGPVTVNPLSPRQRWLAALDCRPADHIPFWPKLDAAYPLAQDEPFRSMALPALHDWIGSDRVQSLGNALRVEFETGFGRQQRVEDDARRKIAVYQTPAGNLESQWEWDGLSCSWHPMKFPVKNLDDILRLRDWYASQRWEIDQRALTEITNQINQGGEATAYAANLEQSALTYWVEWLAGIENAQYLLADYPQQVSELFEAIHHQLKARFRLTLDHQPADFIWLTEDTSTTMISVTQYQTLNAGHIDEYARMCRNAGARLVLHMCGKIKRLLPDLAKMPTRGFEAFTAPPLGDTTLLDGRLACPDKCLIGGTHAMLWLEPADAIISQLRRWLDQLPHHRGIVLTSAGVMPPRCKPQTIREVCEWLKTYPARM